MSNAREKYMLALANLVNGSELGYEDRSSIPQYKKDIEDYVDRLEKVNQELHNKIDKTIKKVKVVKQFDFDKVGRYEILEILKDGNVDE